MLASPVPTDAIASMRLSALVVDLAILGPQAWAWLERLCGALPELGIVVCTGPSTVAQRVRGLRLGADDWITKPCHPEEVIARVQGVVRRRRRSTGRADVKPVSAGEVEIRSDRFQAFVQGHSIDLTRREFELIELLAAAEGRVLEREDIYSRLWGYAMVRGDRSVDVFVRKLRQKLEKASPDWRYIHTHFGIGYRFAAEPADGSMLPGDNTQPDHDGESPEMPAPVPRRRRSGRAGEGRGAGLAGSGGGGVWWGVVLLGWGLGGCWEVWLDVWPRCVWLRFVFYTAADRCGRTVAVFSCPPPTDEFRRWPCCGRRRYRRVFSAGGLSVPPVTDAYGSSIVFEAREYTTVAGVRLIPPRIRLCEPVCVPGLSSYPIMRFPSSLTALVDPSRLPPGY